jgi:HEPN domain-containing protein
MSAGATMASQRKFHCPDFRRAAGQRLTAAEYLLRAELFLDAMYLAGYGVECALKALILARTPLKKRAVKCKEISTGNKGHDFEFLKAELKKAQCSLPPEILKLMGRVAEWTTDWRYKVGLGKHQPAKDFFDAASQIRGWVEERV